VRVDDEYRMIQGRLDAVELELRVLRDIEEIKKLRALFWLACDGDILHGPTHHPEEIADLFTEDGSWTMGGVERDEISWPDSGPHGRAEILNWFRETQRRISFAMHFGVTPIINVNGDQASGQWKLFAAMLRGHEALWVGSIYNDTYLRTAHGWRIQTARVSVGFNTPFSEGWGETRYVPLPHEFPA